MRKNLCDNCKKEIEKPFYINIIVGWVFFVLLFSVITIGLIVGIRLTEALTLGERLIILFLSGIMSFGFIILPLHIEDLKKIYNLPKMKRFKKIGNFFFLPYLLVVIYFVMVIGTTGRYAPHLILQLGNWSFALLIGFPILIDWIRYVNKKKPKKK